jgi:hypothetical protein
MRVTLLVLIASFIFFIRIPRLAVTFAIMCFFPFSYKPTQYSLLYISLHRKELFLTFLRGSVKQKLLLISDQLQLFSTAYGRNREKRKDPKSKVKDITITTHISTTMNILALLCICLELALLAHKYIFN